MRGQGVHRRLAIGPYNVAGQGREWAAALRRSTDIEAFSFAGTRRSTRRIDGPSDRRIPPGRFPGVFVNPWLRRLLRGTTHVLDESLAPLLAQSDDLMSQQSLDLLAHQGIRLGAVFHGSDIRCPDRHQQRISASYFRESDPAWSAELGASAARRRQRYRDGSAVLV